MTILRGGEQKDPLARGFLSTYLILVFIPKPLAIEGDLRLSFSSYFIPSSLSETSSCISSRAEGDGKPFFFFPLHCIFLSPDFSKVLTAVRGIVLNSQGHLWAESSKFSYLYAEESKVFF